MKILTLYIDKWYIIGAICTDGVPRLITLPNKEDRFWLYFYEDAVNDKIIYGKDNQLHYRNKESHYYGDVFSLITDPHAYFNSFGHKREMPKIFSASGILEELRKAIGIDSEIATYISFSDDISDAARLVFLKLLKDEKFEIKESVARIEQLALEYGFHRKQFQEEGYHLVLSAYNENLHYSLYEHTDKFFLRHSEGSLKGLGTDLRSHALIKTVVKSINDKTHFLSTQREIEEEYLRMGLYVGNWIVKLENTKPPIPVTIPNVFFSKQPNNTYPVTIIRKKLDEHTTVIANDIIRVITDFVKSKIRLDEVKSIILLGNTFTNAQFGQALSEKFILNATDFIRFKESDLPNIIGVYSVIDCKQFSDENQAFAYNSEAELKRIQNAKEEKLRQEQAKCEQAKIEEIEKFKHDLEKKYKEAINQALDYEKQQDYAQMRDWCDIALQHKPDDDVAKQKMADATRLIAEETAIAKQYNTIIQRAKKSLEANQWSDARAQSEAAMNVRHNSKEAQRIYDEACKQIDLNEKVRKFITMADLYVAQKSYVEAIDELKKALALNEKSEDAKNKLLEIEQKCKEIKIQLQGLMSQLQTAEAEGNYIAAIAICEKLIDADSLNIRKWSERTQYLKVKLQTKEEEKQKLQKLQKDIDSSIWDEDWERVTNLCKHFLEIREVADIRNKLQRAEARFEEEREKQKFKKSIETVKALMVDKKWENAKNSLNNLQHSFPNEVEQLKKLRAQIFEAEDNDLYVRNRKEKDDDRPIIKGFTSKKVKLENSFFDDEKLISNKKATPSSAPKEQSKTKQVDTPKLNSDFFDSNEAVPTNESTNKNISKLTNNNFNF